MKRLLIATAALGLLTAGAAFAQDTQSGIGPAGQPAQPTPAMPAKPADAVRSPSITPQSTGTPAPAIVDTGTGAPPPVTDPASPSATSPAPLAAATTSTATGQVVGDMNTTNPPPAAGAYPRCTHKGQDRCVVTARLHHRAMRSSTRSGL